MKTILNMKINKLKNLIKEEIKRLIEQTCGPCGDLNGDGQITIEDAEMMADILQIPAGGNVENITSCPQNIPGYWNGNVGLYSVVAIQQVALGNLDYDDWASGNTSFPFCDICANFESSIPVSVSSFCTKCETNSWVGSGYEQYCECCPENPPSLPHKDKNPLKNRFQKLAKIKPIK